MFIIYKPMSSCYLGDASVYFPIKVYRGMLNLKLLGSNNNFFTPSIIQ